MKLKGDQVALIRWILWNGMLCLLMAGGLLAGFTRPVSVFVSAWSVISSVVLLYLLLAFEKAKRKPADVALYKNLFIGSRVLTLFLYAVVNGSAWFMGYRGTALILLVEYVLYVTLYSVVSTSEIWRPASAEESL